MEEGDKGRRAVGSRKGQLAVMLERRRQPAVTVARMAAGAETHLAPVDRLDRVDRVDRVVLVDRVGLVDHPVVYRPTRSSGRWFCPMFCGISRRRAREAAERSHGKNCES